MAMSVKQTAYRAGDCSRCRGTIPAGGIFYWGRRPRERWCPACNDAETGAELVPRVRPDQPKRDWSGYQEAYFAALLNGEGSIVLQAAAGSGKTASIEEGFRRLAMARPHVRCGYLTFNARNAEEAREKLGDLPSVTVSTFHSAGWRALLGARNGNKPKVDGRKVPKILRDMADIGQISPREFDSMGRAAVRLTALAKLHGIGAGVSADTQEYWVHLLDHYDVTFEVLPGEYPSEEAATERLVEIARSLLRASNARTDVADFDDQIYTPLREGIPLPRYDVLAVDEAQDTNPTRRAMLRQMLAEGGRLVAVGDRRQAIYGFTGADADALDQISRDFGCVEMALPICYRCASSIVELAKRICPEIEARPGAPLGTVETVDTMDLSDFGPADAVLCRVTAPLIRLAYRAIGAKVACKVLGRDIGEGLANLITKLTGKGTISIDELLVRLDQWEDREIARWMVKGQSERAQSAQDKAACIRVGVENLPEDARTVERLLADLSALFGEDAEDQRGGVQRLTLATVHKSKGLQWATVYLLDPDRMPSKWARQDWQVEQERNLVYVAITRAETTLKYVFAQDITG